MDAGDILSFKRMQKRHFLLQILPVFPDGGLFFHAHLFRENMVHRHFLSLKRRLFCSLHFYFFLMYLPIVPLAAIKITICRLNQYSTYILYMAGFVAQFTIRNPSTIIRALGHQPHITHRKSQNFSFPADKKAYLSFLPRIFCSF